MRRHAFQAAFGSRVKADCGCEFTIKTRKPWRNISYVAVKDVSKCGSVACYIQTRGAWIKFIDKLAYVETADDFIRTLEDSFQ